MSIIILAVAFLVLTIEPAFSLPLFVAAAMFAFWGWHDRVKRRQTKLQAQAHR
jgi:chromate transport protein ChrA